MSAKVNIQGDIHGKTEVTEQIVKESFEAEAEYCEMADFTMEKKSIDTRNWMGKTPVSYS